MSELNYIGADELVFNNDPDLGIASGGFSVNSIMMKAGMSPIMTINTEQFGGKNEKVSDLFDNLVVPSWVLSYNNRLVGGKYENNSDDDSGDEEDEVIDDDLHDKLLELVKEHNKNRKKTTRKHKKVIYKKGGTKRKK